MSEYTLVNKQSLVDIANAIRGITGKQNELVFPDDFIAEINSFISAPSSETLTLIFENGTNVYNSSSQLYEGMVAVGANSSHANDDAVWSFTPNINATSATVELQWQGEDGYYWNSVDTYAFYITTDGSEGQKIPASSNSRIVSTFGGTGGGTTILEFTSLNLQANQKYYIRANYKNYTEYSNLKPFYKNNNTIIINK